MARKKERSDLKGYAPLLKDKQVERWFDNLARGSPITAEVYLRRLGAFGKRYGVTPNSLIRMGQKRIKNLLLDLVNDLSKEKKAGSYIHSNVKAVKSWLSFNEIEVKTKIRIEGAQNTPTLNKERVPTRQELQKIVEGGDSKQRVACALMAHSGLRPETLGTFRGEDGLKISDFPELKLGDGVEFEKVPTILQVRSELSKAGHTYFSFLTEEGCRYLKEYLEERIRSGEKLDADSPIITPKRNRIRPHVATTNIGDMVRVVIRRARFDWRPYVLRAYFDTQLMLAESRGLVIRDYRTFWMGHKGDIENRYTTNKGRLPPDLIEEMRTSFKKASEFLESTKVEATPDQIAKLKQEMTDETKKLVELNSLENTLAMLPLRGPLPETLYDEYKKEHRLTRELAIEEKIDALRGQAEVIRRELRRVFGESEEGILEDYGHGSPAETLRKASGKNRDEDPQAVIDQSALSRYLNGGWQYVDQLKSGKIVVRK